VKEWNKEERDETEKKCKKAGLEGKKAKMKRFGDDFVEEVVSAGGQVTVAQEEWEESKETLSPKRRRHEDLPPDPEPDKSHLSISFQVLSSLSCLYI